MMPAILLARRQAQLAILTRMPQPATRRVTDHRPFAGKPSPDAQPETLSGFRSYRMRLRHGI